MPITKIPSELSQMLRYVHEVDPPTLLKAFDDYLVSTAARQSGGVGDSWWTQVFGRRPATIRKMLRHERPLDAIVLKRLVEALNLTYMDALALFLANAPSKLIGDICRADGAGGPRREQYACAAPRRTSLYRISLLPNRY